MIAVRVRMKVQVTSEVSRDAARGRLTSFFCVK